MISCYIKKIILVIGLLISIGYIFGIYYDAHADQGYICHFNGMRDTHAILDIFKDNWTELVAPNDYSPEFMMKNRKPDPDSECVGLLKIKVMRERNRLAGFTAYYKESLSKGVVLFLAVGHDFRGKGYGYRLMKDALSDLLSMGVKNIGLWVLIENVPARRIYEKLGFREQFQQDENSYFEYFPEQKDRA